MSALVVYYYNDDGRADANGLNFRAGDNTENGNDSRAASESYVRWKTFYGNVTNLRVVAHSKGSAQKGEPKPEEYKDDYWKLPDWARSFTVEGRRENPGVMVCVSHLMVGK